MRERSRASLIGTSVGDALGEQLYLRENAEARRLPAGPWRWTDDTEMACSVFHVLDKHGHMDPDALAASFIAHYDVDRNYGAGVDGMMREIRRGANLRELAAQTFGGTGSWGNGGAMRIAPLGAWFTGDPAEAARQAEIACRVTHTHPEGVAGAIATAAAAAVDPAHLFDEVLRHTPPGLVHDGITRAAAMRDATPGRRRRGTGHGPPDQRPGHGATGAVGGRPPPRRLRGSHLDDRPTGRGRGHPVRDRGRHPRGPPGRGSDPAGVAPGRGAVA